MKKIISTTLFGAIFMLPQTVLGASCIKEICDQYNDALPIVTPQIMGDISCNKYSEFCFTSGGKAYKGQSCDRCADGYTLVKVTEHYHLCPEGVMYYICRKNSDPCANCGGSVIVDLPGFPNYRYTAKEECVNDECITTYTYHCSEAAYGNYPANCTTDANGAVSSCSGCTACPTATNVYTDPIRTSATRAKGQTRSIGASTTVDNCLLPIGTYYDAGGKFSITGSSAGSGFISSGCPY